MSQNQKLQLQYDQYQQTIESINTRLITLQSEIEEHEIVMSTLTDVSEDRNCYRMIGGALVELKVSDAKVVLGANLKGMKGSVDSLKLESDKFQKEFLDWKEKNNVKVVKGN